MDPVSDLRVPIIIGGHPAAGDALLVPVGDRVPEGFYGMSIEFGGLAGHAAACACCTPRNAVPAALAAMFRARATGSAPFFKRIIIMAPQSLRSNIEQAVGADIFTASRYRIQTER